MSNRTKEAAAKIIFVPLDKLKKSPNVRKIPHTKAEIMALAASIGAIGMLQYPVVEPETGAHGKPTGFYLVNAGEGRRLAQVLRAKRKEIKRDEPIRCILDTEHNGTELSLAENAVRFAMHPADQYEAFAKLHREDGMGPEDIAARFGVTPAVVRQRLKLDAAARMPAGADATMLDIGRSVALWSSAFEILAPARREAYMEVYALLEKTAWHTEGCKNAVYEAYGYSRDNILRNLPCWLFGAINHARNDYLHGNPITRDRLIVAPAKRPLQFYAPILYRIASAAFVELQYTPSPQHADETEYQAYLRNYHVFGRYQGEIEVALLSIMYTEDEWRTGAHRKASRPQGGTDGVGTA